MERLEETGREGWWGEGGSGRYGGKMGTKKMVGEDEDG